MIDHLQYSSFSFFPQVAILPSVKYSIVIPVKDEEVYILNALNSFSSQTDLCGNVLDPSQFEILVLANNCSDHTADIIRKFQLEFPTLNIHLQEIKLPPDLANIGYIRRKLMDRACERLCENGGGIIMTTDGDTMVASDWIAQTEMEIRKGAEVVGGRILLYQDELDSLDDFTRHHHLKDEHYHLLTAELEGQIFRSDIDPHPRHHQHFNGSFAITTDCYAKSGGVPDVKQLEDCAFFERLESVDARIRHSNNVTVRTSARWIGRAEIGLSYQLNVWKNLDSPIENYLVESAESIIRRCKLKKQLHDLWLVKDDFTQSSFNEYLRSVDSHMENTDQIYQNLAGSIYFGEFYRKVSHQNKDIFFKNFPPVSIDKAISDLQTKIKELNNQDFSQISIL